MASVAKSSIALGIDIGSDKCVVAFVDKKGVVDVLQNESSKRETPVVVHFDKRQRLFGSAGAARANMDPKSTISQLKRLIGRRFHEPSFQEERKLLPYETSTGPTGDVMVNVGHLNEGRKYTSVEMLGMFLCYLKRMAEKATESTISECVIGIPSYFTDRQRRDYLLAAEVAGLKPLRLFHDGAATALDYGIYRDLPFGEEINVVFVDIGHCDTQVTAVKFVSGMAMVLAHSFDRDLGGRDFDNVIFMHLARKFFEQHNVDVLTHQKASFRLRVACEKVKKILSSNTEAPINMESLMDEKDFEGVITKKEFEDLSMSSGLLDKIRTACENVLGESGLFAEQINSVEVVGSGSRIPMILSTLEEFFGRKVSRTLNGSECVANGCALQCAMLSSAHKITTFAVQDIFPFSIFVPGSITVAKGMRLLTAKVLVLRPSKIINLSYADVKELPLDTSTSINQYMIDSIDESKDANVEVRIHFDRHGIVCVQYVSETTMERSGRSPRRFTLKDSKSKYGVSVERILQRARSLETKLAEQDRANENAKLLRNSLESNIFQIRNELLRTIARSANWASISKELHDMEEWLYGLGADESGDGYKKKMNELSMIRQNIAAENERAITRAKTREKELECFTFHRIMRAVSGRLQSFMTKDDHVIISDKIKYIEQFLRGGLKSEEDYIKEMEKLKLIVDPFEIQYRAAQSANLETAGGGVNVPCSPLDNSPPPPAVFCHQKLASMIKQGGYIIIRGCPCQVTDVSTNNDKKCGPAMCHFMGVDIFNGEKLEMNVPSSNYCDVPSVSYPDYTLFCISKTGFARLRTMTGKPRDDMWISTDDNLLCQINDKLEKRDIVVMRVISAMGEEQIFSVNCFQPEFLYHQLAGTIRPKTFILISGRACEVVEACTKRAAKHEPAMCHFIGIDIFNGETLEAVVPSSHYCAVPVVSYSDYMIVGASKGYATLRTVTGELRNDILVRTDKFPSGLINQRPTDRGKLLVNVISAMGDHQILSVKFANPKLDRQQLASTVCLNDYMLIKGRPCVVAEVFPYKAGFITHAKRRFVGIDMINGEKLEDTVLLSQYCDVPLVQYANYQLIDITKDGFAILKFDSGNFRKRFSSNEIQTRLIKRQIEEGNNVIATVISVMGDMQHICSVKYIHPLLESHQLARTVLVDSYIIIEGRPCKVTRVDSYRERNNERPKCHFVGIDIFDGEELAVTVESSHYCDIPRVGFIPYQLVKISDEGFADLVSESGSQRDPLWLSTDKSLHDQINKNLSVGNIVIVTLMSAMKMEKFHSLHYNCPINDHTDLVHGIRPDSCQKDNSSGEAYPTDGTENLPGAPSAVASDFSAGKQLLNGTLPQAIDATSLSVASEKINYPDIDIDMIDVNDTAFATGSNTKEMASEKGVVSTSLVKLSEEEQRMQFPQ